MNQVINEQQGVEVCKANHEDKPILVNLLSLYLHEFSEYNKFLTISDDGLFHYGNDIDFFWKGNYFPYFIKVDGKIAGFVILMVDTADVPADCDYDMCEFFIIKPHRRKGIGSIVINKIFDMHPGKYHVVELANNKPAIDFWHNIYKSRGISYEEKERDFGELKGIYQKFNT